MPTTRLRVLMLGLSLSLSCAVQADDVTKWRELRQAAAAAYEAKDYVRCRDRLLELSQLLHGPPRVVTSLASVEALSGNSRAALDWLRVLAQMGITFDAAADPDFASLRTTPEFTATVELLRKNQEPVSRSSVVRRLPAENLITEDVAYDPVTRTFYVSSVHKRKILALHPDGSISDFVPPGKEDAVLAVSVDAKRRLLWATTARMSQQEGYQAQEKPRSAVLRYSLENGRLLQRFEVPAAPGQDCVAGDMALGSKGEVFVSEAVSGIVYQIRPGAEKLEPLTERGVFFSPQTPAPAGRKLYVADYVRGIGIVDLRTGRTDWLAHDRTAALNGIDGLYSTGRTLFAVQNGVTPNRVLRIRLNRKGDRAAVVEIIESNSPGLGAPTHGVLVGRDFYFLADSGWDKVDDNGVPKPDTAPATPALMRYRLPKRLGGKPRL